MPVRALRFKFPAREHNYEQLARWAFEVTSSRKDTHIHASTHAHTLERKENITVDCSGPIKMGSRRIHTSTGVSFPAQQPHSEERGRMLMLSVVEKEGARRGYGERENSGMRVDSR